MRYRICKMFTVESGHMLSKHPERCRYLHGHTRQIEVVLSSERLDDREMVCDFKTIKLAIGAYLDQYDHAMAVNTQDPMYAVLQQHGQRIIPFENEDPTTEVLARAIFEYVEQTIARGESYVHHRTTDGPPSSSAPTCSPSTPADGPLAASDATPATYHFPPGLRLDRIRVWETPSSWAEYGRE